MISNISTTLTVLLDASLRCVLVFGLAGAGCLLLRNRAAAVRHGVWTTAVVLALLLPALSAVLPSWRLGVLPDVVAVTTSPEPESTLPTASPISVQDPAPQATTPIASLPQTEIAAAESVEETSVSVTSVESSPAETTKQSAYMEKLRDVSVSTWILLVWAAGVVVMFLSMLTGTIAIRRVARKSKHITDASILSMKDRLCEELAIHQPVLMLQSDESFVPVTWGIWWPTVLLPREAKDWSTQRLRMVLLHELAHIKRADCMTQLLVQLTRAIYWFHPLVWWAGRNLRIQRERACDDLVLSAGIAGPEYADQLLQIVRSLRSGKGTPLAAVAMARKSQFESRLLSVLDTARRRGGLSRKLAWAILAASLAVALPIAALQPVARAQQDAPSKKTIVQESDDENSISKDKLIGWVEKFLSQNYRDITARKTLEWGPPEKTTEGNYSIRYKFLATIWRKDKMVIEKRFIFTPEGKYVSAETIEQTPVEKDGNAEKKSQPADNMPIVVKTTPAAFTDDVDPRLTKITVTFDRPMMDGNWSWTGGGETYPKTTGKIFYDKLKKTCTLPVKLEPGKVYWVGINSPSYQNFKTADRKPAKRYVILFATKSASGKPTPIPANMLQQAKQINGVPAQEVAVADTPEKSRRQLLDEQTRKDVAKCDRMFASWFQPNSRYELASKAQKERMVTQWMKEAQSDDFKKRTAAIAMLGNVKAKQAVDVLIEIVEEPMNNCRPKWLAVRALGEIGDLKAVPTLIGLVDFGNWNTRIYARAALAEITGVYFGEDKDKWTQWWKQNAPKESTKDNTETRTPKKKTLAELKQRAVALRKEMKYKAAIRVLEQIVEIDPKNNWALDNIYMLRKLIALQEQQQTAAPVVVKTTPAALANDVDPGLKEITVTFDHPMKPRSWSWTTGRMKYPKVTGDPQYDEARTTCTLPVQLVPGQVYWVGVNYPGFMAFQDDDGKASKPYVILFATKSADGKPTPIPEDVIEEAKNFNLASRSPSMPLTGLAIPLSVMYHVTGAYLPVAMPYWHRNQQANAQIYLVTDANQLVFAAMLPVYNSTKEPWTTERKLTNSSYNDLLVFNTQNPEGSKPKCRWVDNKANRSGHYSLMWTPRYPLNPGDSRLFLMQKPEAQPLVCTDGNMNIRMQNHLSATGVEQFYLVVPAGREVKNISRKWTSKSAVDGYDVYCFQTEVTPETNNVVTATVSMKAGASSSVSDVDKLKAENASAEGWKLWQQRKLSEAETRFQQAVKLDPTNTNAWNGLGWSQFNQGKPMNAWQAFEACVKLEPQHAAALNGLGWIAKGQGKTDEAIGYWTKAVEAAPTATAALNGLTQTYMEQKKYDDAIKYYEMWLKVEPNNKDAKQGLQNARKAAKANPKKVSQKEAAAVKGNDPSQKLAPNAEFPRDDDYIYSPEADDAKHSSKEFSALGAVAKPGFYRMTRPDMRLLEALAKVGGITKANIRYLYVIRSSDGEVKQAPTGSEGEKRLSSPRIIAIDLAKLEAGDPKMNIIIRGKDIIQVPACSSSDMWDFRKIVTTLQTSPAGLAEAYDKKDWTKVNRLADDISDAARRLSYSLDSDLLRAKVERGAGSSDGRDVEYLLKAEKVKREAEEFLGNKARDAKFRRLLELAYRLGDEVHDLARDGKYEQLPTQYKELAKVLDELGHLYLHNAIESCQVEVTKNDAQAIQTATKAAEGWLKVIDAGEYAKSWDEMAAVSKSAVTKEQWVKDAGVLKEFGPVKSRKLLSADYTTTLPSAPDGEYVILCYQAEFANKAKAVETITPMKDKDGTWRVSGYYVK